MWFKYNTQWRRTSILPHYGGRHATLFHSAEASVQLFQCSPVTMNTPLPYTPQYITASIYLSGLYNPWPKWRISVNDLIFQHVCLLIYYHWTLISCNKGQILPDCRAVSFKFMLSFASLILISLFGIKDTALLAEKSLNFSLPWHDAFLWKLTKFQNRLYLKQFNFWTKRKIMFLILLTVASIWQRSRIPIRC